MKELITYPLNDVDYSAEDAGLFHCTRTSGVWHKDSFPITVSGADNTVTIGKGLAWFSNDEFWGKVAAQKTVVELDLEYADPAYDRIDIIALQFDANKNATNLIVKKGEAKTNPTIPVISRTEALYELYLYAITRPAASVTIASSNVRDLRLDDEYCGLMADSVTSLDFPIVPVEKGGTGKEAHTSNSVLVGNGNGAVKNITSASGALFSTGAGVEPKFGILPIEQGGTGAGNAKDAVRNLGLVTELEQIAANKKAIAERLPLSGGELTGDLNLTGNLNIGHATIYASNGQCENLKVNRMWHFGDNTEVAVINKMSNTYALCPTTDNEKYLGSSSYKWKQLYAGTSTINPSDRNLKRDINDLDDKYIQLFDLIRPVSYYLKDGDRIHTGFIAQEVEEAMVQVGLTAEELGFFCRDILTEPVYDDTGEWIENKEVYDESDNPVYIYGLRYSEYIAITAAKVKVLEKRIEKLEAMISEL